MLVPSPEIGDLLGGLGGPRTRLWVIDTASTSWPTPARSTGRRRRPGPDEPPGWLLRGLSRLTRAVVRGPAVEVGPEAPGAHEVERGPRRRAGHAPARGRRLARRRPLRRAPGPGRGPRAAAPSSSRRPRPTSSPSAAAPSTASWAASWRCPCSGPRRSSPSPRACPSGSAGCATGSSSSTEGSREPPADVPDAGAGDEIGDLARSVAGLAERQREHTAYLEQVGQRLSHEMRTPVGVVRSSLDNLRPRRLPAGRPRLPRPGRRGPAPARHSSSRG